MAKTETRPKPEISKEAKHRIRMFALELDALQRRFGVELAVQDDSLAFRDMRRTDDWEGYGEWDAQIFNCAEKVGRVRARNLHFEDFAIWDQ